MAQTNVNIRMDEKLKIPFEISSEADPFYSEANQKHLREAILALDAGKGVQHDIIEVDDE